MMSEQAIGFGREDDGIEAMFERVGRGDPQRVPTRNVSF
jgi:hypothetical protein